jgi:hypothetical protein
MISMEEKIFPSGLRGRGAGDNGQVGFAKLAIALHVIEARERFAATREEDKTAGNAIEAKDGMEKAMVLTQLGLEVGTTAVIGLCE